MPLDLHVINAQLRNQEPAAIIAWALEQGKRPIVTTNFRPYEASILHACSQVKADIPVIWCDSGYNTRNTYVHAQQVIEQLALNVFLYVPKQTAAHRDVVMGGIPTPDDELHERFTEEVKLEPFRRALSEHKPDVWFTNLRKGQTAFRDTLDIVTQGDDGVLKVSPFFYYSDEQLDAYLKTHALPNEHKYFDPTKADEKRECGLHTRLNA